MLNCLFQHMYSLNYHCFHFYHNESNDNLRNTYVERDSSIDDSCDYKEEKHSDLKLDIESKKTTEKCDEYHQQTSKQAIEENETLKNLQVKQEQERLRFRWYNLLLGFSSIFIYFIDVLTDVGLAITYFAENEPELGAVTLLFVVINYVINFVHGVLYFAIEMEFVWQLMTFVIVPGLILHQGPVMM